MLAKVIGLSKGGIVSAQKVLAYLGRDGADQAHELAQFGAPEMGAINLDVDLITPEDRKEVAQLWDYMVSCNQAIRSNPFYHVSISWQEGEHPALEEVQKGCLHAMQALGMERCDAVWAIHRDTDNDHVHLVINRVQSEDLKLVAVPAWDYLKLDKAMREIEFDQGWNHDNGPWIALEVEGKTQIVRMSREERRKRGLLQDANRVGDGALLTQAAIRSEKNSGADSFQRWVAGKPAGLLKQVLAQDSPSWEKVHEALAGQGLKIIPKGSGLIVVGQAEDDSPLAAKASQLGRFATKSALEKTLGPYVPATGGLAIAPSAYALEQKTKQNKLAQAHAHAKDRIDPLDKRALARQARSTDRVDLMKRFEAEQLAAKQTRKSERETQKQEHGLEKSALQSKLKEARLQAKLLAKQTGGSVAIALSLAAFEAAKEREQLLARHALERKQLSSTLPRAQVWRLWLEAQVLAGDGAAKSALRGIEYKEKRASNQDKNAIEGQSPEEDVEGHLQQRKLAQLQARVDAKNKKVAYLDSRGITQFTDVGPRIQMHSNTSGSIEAALKLAAQKYGGHITITGSSQFREQAARSATRLGLKVLDKDLAPIVAHEKQLQKERYQNGRSFPRPRSETIDTRKPTPAATRKKDRGMER